MATSPSWGSGTKQRSERSNHARLETALLAAMNIEPCGAHVGLIWSLHQSMCVADRDQRTMISAPFNILKSAKPCHIATAIHTLWIKQYDLRSRAVRRTRDLVQLEFSDSHAMQTPCSVALFRYLDTPARSGSFAVRYRSSSRSLLRIDVQTSAASAPQSLSSSTRYETVAVMLPASASLDTLAISYRAHLNSEMGCLHDRDQTLPADSRL